MPPENPKRPDLHCDLLVVGGGTAGFGAAVAAARCGLSVTLVEATSQIGGVMAACPGMPWGGAYPQDQLIGGLMAELSERLGQQSPPAARKRPCSLANFGPEILYDPDQASLVMFEMLETAGVDLRLGTIALKPQMHGQHIEAVQCADRHGLFSVKPALVIDCSGDGDLSAKAGVSFELGDANGQMMAVTVSFHMQDVDIARAFADNDPYFQAYAARGVASLAIHPDLAKLYLAPAFQPHSVFCNSVHIRGVDGTDALAVARATQEGRRRAHALSQFLRTEVPGFEAAYLTKLSAYAGVRETRKLEGVYRLRGVDIARGTKFEDGIVACDNPVDDVMRGAGAMTHEAALEGGDYYTLPFRSLMPKNIDNLLFAGRILCADAQAFASVRGMPQCMAMGQATGSAAALALAHRCAVQALPIAALIASLREQGVNRLTPACIH